MPPKGTCFARWSIGGRILLSMRSMLISRTVARVAGAAVAVLLAVVAGAMVTAARASDKGTMQAVLTAQIATNQQEQALNKCLAASPHKNTPCIRREARKLAALDGRQIAAITAALDGTEQTCVRTVANQEIAYLKLWKTGSLALAANQRTKARRLFLKSVPIAKAQRPLEKRCFVEVGGGP